MSRRLATGTRTRKPKDVATEAPELIVDLFVKEKSAEAAARKKVCYGLRLSLTDLDERYLQQGTIIDETLRSNRRAPRFRVVIWSVKRSGKGERFLEAFRSTEADSLRMQQPQD